MAKKNSSIRGGKGGGSTFLLQKKRKKPTHTGIREKEPLIDRLQERKRIKGNLKVHGKGEALRLLVLKKTGKASPLKKEVYKIGKKEKPTSSLGGRE